MVFVAALLAEIVGVRPRFRYGYNVIHGATYPTAQLTYLNRTLPFQHHENQWYQYFYINSLVIPIALTIQRCDTDLKE